MSDQVVSLNKFHSIFGKILGIAFETTFPPEAIIRSLGQDYPNLVHHGFNSRKVYHPAIADGDVSNKESGSISFIPWVDGSDALFHRICFRSSLGRNSFDRWIRMGRFGEENVFGFEDPKKPFVNLDFVSKTDTFVPVFIKIQDGDSFVYIKVEAGEVSEEGISISVKKIKEEEVPQILVISSP